ncbi:hypothetical protein [Poriferisphaera sp. WC338]|uniref:hypothetical protein n=1 Tax=Poriferisphaera sp. WC338 TaxID=3425129 RepID=UPI003D81B9D0
MFNCVKTLSTLIIILSACTTSAWAASTYRLAIYRDASTDGVSSIYIKQMRKAGFEVSALDISAITNPTKFNIELFDAVVLLNSDVAPARIMPHVHEFMLSGGDGVFLGGELFANPKSDLALAGKSEASINAKLLEGESAFKIDIAKPFTNKTYTKESKHASQVMYTKPVIKHGRKGMVFTVKDFSDGWAGWAIPTKNVKTKNANVMRLWLRGDGHTPTVAFEIREKGGARWVTHLQPSTKWKNVAVRLDEFQLFRNGGDNTRGKKGDLPQLKNIAAVTVGFADEFFTTPSGDHTFSIAGVEFANVVLPKITHYENAFQANDFTLYCFDYMKAYGLPAESSISLRKELKQYFDWEGGVGGGRGVSAIGVALPFKSQFYPILEVNDKFDRYAGWGLSLLHNFDGKYKNGYWLFSGIDDASLIKNEQFVKVVIDAIKHIAKQDKKWRKHAELPYVKKGTRLGGKCSRLRVSETGDALVDQSGKPVFLIGANYIGPSGRPFIYCGDKFWSSKLIESDFMQASAMGINAFRFWLGAELVKDPKRTKTLIRAAEKSGIYLMIHLRGDGQVEQHPVDVNDIVNEFKPVIQAFKGQDVVIGYDLQNEPYITTIGAITVNGELSKIVKLRPAERYKKYINTIQLERNVKEKPPWPLMPSWANEDVRRQLYAAEMLWNMIPTPFDDDQTCQLPPHVIKEVQGAVSATFDDWMSPFSVMIKEIDPNALVTVGYNTDLVTMACNKKLDWHTQHTYVRPRRVKDTLKNVKKMDLLRKLYPHHPASLGEFGYTCGFTIGDKQLGPNASAVAEMSFYLYAYAHNHTGVFKWKMHDAPIPYAYDQIWWTQNSVKNMRYESAFGLTRYDGSPSGKTRPIGYGLAHFAKFINQKLPKGDLKLTSSGYLGDVSYEYIAPNAIFIGHKQYTKHGLTFESSEPTNMMLSWYDKKLFVTSTADANITINAAMLTGKLPANGSDSGLQIKDHMITGSVLAGKTYTFSLVK